MNRRHYRIPLLLAGFTGLFFWSVWLTGATFPRGGGDLWGQLYPVWAGIARNLRHGALSLWATQLMAGDPIIAESQYGVLNPLNWWVFLFSPIPHWVMSLRGMLSLWLAGWGMYVYVRRSPLWGLSRAAALVGATAYMFSDSFVVHLGHPPIDDAMAWLPWSFYAVDRALQHPRRAALAGIPPALMILAGHYQAASYGLAAVALYGLWRLSEMPAPQKSLLGLMVAALVALALALPVLLPGIERYPLTERAILHVQQWRGYQWDVAQMADWVAAGFHGSNAATFWGPRARVESGSVGIAALSLAVVGLLSNLRRKRGWLLLVLGGLAVAMAMGYDGPLYPWLARVDAIARMDKTARAIYVFSFAVALAAAAGTDALPRRKRSLPPLLMLYLGLAGVLLTQAGRWSAAAPSAAMQLHAAQSLRQAGVILALACLLMGAAARRLPWGKTGLVLLVLGELIAVGSLAEMDPHQPTAPSPVIAYLKQDPGWFRVDVDGKARGLMSPAVLQGYGFEVPQGSGDPLELFSYTQFYWAVPYKGAPVYQLFGVKYIIVPKGALPGGDGIWPVFQDDPHVDVHLNTNAMNRIWLVYHTQPVRSIEEARTVLFAQDFDPLAVATVENGPALQEQGQGQLQVLSYGPNRVRFGVQTSAPALLVLSDMFYPGWRGWVDGQATAIYKTDGIFRGVLVPAGQHVVEMRFFPRGLGRGLTAAAFALLLLGWTQWGERGLAFLSHKKGQR